MICLCLISISSYAQVDTALLRAEVTKVQRKFAPDKRSVYFTLQFKRDSVFVESTSAEALKAVAEINKHTPFNASLVQLPSGSLNGMLYGVANLSVCNNRVHPSHSAELVTQMILGTPVEILKRQSGFYLVKTPDGYISWIDGAAVAPMNKASFDEWKSAKKVVFLPDYGHAFQSPDMNALRVSDLVAGDILQVLSTDKNFYKVQFPDKRQAFIPVNQATSYTEWANRPVPTASSILESAKDWLGVPYLWGGTSTKGMDCSGFTKTAYFLNGVIIPRDASQQALVGKSVDILDGDSLNVAKSLRNLQPGDLLFFSAAKARGISGGRVTHTAIYMGNGEFIQAAGMIRINSLVPGTANYDRSQAHTIVSARNILSNIGSPEITKVVNHPWYASK